MSNSTEAAIRCLSLVIQSFYSQSDPRILIVFQGLLQETELFVLFEILLFLLLVIVFLSLYSGKHAVTESKLAEKCHITQKDLRAFLLPLKGDWLITLSNRFSVIGFSSSSSFDPLKNL